MGVFTKSRQFLCAFPPKYSVFGGNILHIYHNRGIILLYKNDERLCLIRIYDKGVFIMTYTHGVQVVSTYPGKRILKSSADGATNVEEVKWLTDKLVELSKSWKGSGWAYVCDISKMPPVTPDVSTQLVELHKALEASGCKAMAFVNFAAFITGAQAKEHQKKSHAAIQENSFRTEEEALKWIDTIIK